MNKEKLIHVLLELQQASKSINSEQDFLTITQKYNLTFGGGKNNHIHTDELAIILQEKFEIKVKLDELNSLIPAICPSLGMTFKPLFLHDDPNHLNPSSYLIILW